MHDAVLPAVAAPVHADPLEFDLSGITLDLPEAAPPAHHALSDALNLTPSASGRMATAPDDFTELDLHTPSDDEGASSGDISSNAEMATKLDLAVAYQEIGDQDGARELLDEVKKGGSPEQSEKASALLARLG